MKRNTASFTLWVAFTALLLAFSTRPDLALSQGLRQGLPGVGTPAVQGNVTWKLSPDPEEIRPGEWLGIRFDFSIDSGWKMYALDSPAGRPLQITFPELPEGFSLEEVRQSEPKEGFDPNFQEDVRYFENSGTAVAGLKIDGDVAPGTYTLEGRITRMLCNDQMCLPPRAEPVTATIQVIEGAARESFVDPRWGLVAPIGEDRTEKQINELTDLETSQAGGLFGFLLLAIGAGLGALLMPCVFPMIPLTVSYFTKHAGTRSEAFRMAGVYGLAIVLTFTGLGVLMALLVGAAGAQTIASNPWVNLFIGLVFIVFAFSLLGLFELRLPTGLLNYFNRQSNQQSGYLGVLFMGLTLTLVSFSCTAPFVGGLLAATAGGAWMYPIVGMLVFSATFALPFVLFALFPKGMTALPRSGSWMNTLKVVLGFIELAAALKFLSNADLVWSWGIISRPVAIALTSVILFLTGLYLLGKLRLVHEPPVEQIGVVRLLCSIAFFGFSLYLIPGLLGAPLGPWDAYLPPRQATDVSLLAGISAPLKEASHESEAWHVDDMASAVQQAEQERKPLFIDFTGYTCTNCRQMEANVFPDAQVNERLSRDFVLVRLYTDGLENGETFQRYQLRLTGTVALPTYAIVTSSEQLLSKWSGIASVKQFVTFLDQGKKRFATSDAAGSTELVMDQESSPF